MGRTTMASTPLICAGSPDFIALAEEFDPGRAADRLEIAQPPLSRLVGRIEADVGAKLVDRSRSQIRSKQPRRGRRSLALCPGNHPSGQRSDCRGRATRVRQERQYCGSVSSDPLPTAFCRRSSRHSAGRHPDVELTLSAMNNAGLKGSAHSS